jgi:ubiquinone biosynthesis protein UbiJ
MSESGESDDEPDVVELAGGKIKLCPVSVIRSLCRSSLAAARQHVFRLTRRHGLEFQRVRVARSSKPRSVCDFATAAKLVFLARCSASTETRLRYVASLANHLGERAHDDVAYAQLRDAHREQVASMRAAHEALRARVDRLESELEALRAELFC